MLNVQAVNMLLVEDDPAVRQVYSRILRRNGFQVLTAANGSEARAAFIQGSVELVISDIAMPEMNGVALLKALRDQDLDVPVILMTGNPEVQTAAEAVALGALRYLTKPIDTAELTGLSTASRGSTRLPPTRMVSIASGMPWPRIRSLP